MSAKPKKTGKPAEKEKEKVVAQNRAASYNYHLLEKFEAGMVLTGTEVKALRDGKANLRDGYATIRGGEAWLLHCHISPYVSGGPWNHEALRPRKLLLKRQEIDKLAGKTIQKGLTLIPLRIYFRNGRAKCEVALARGKKHYDRRRDERDKESRREVTEAMYRSRRR